MDKDNFTWQTREGDTYKLKDMDTDHIENCIIHLIRGMRTESRDRRKGIHCIRLMCDQLESRKDYIGSPTIEFFEQQKMAGPDPNSDAYLSVTN